MLSKEKIIMVKKTTCQVKLQNHKWIKALEDWQEDHEKDETVQELINKLDAMSMNW